MSQEDDILKAAVASPFISRGESEIDRKSFVNYLSINMGWIPPAAVEDLLKLAFLYGFVDEVDGRIRIAPGMDKVNMRDFNPQRIEEKLRNSKALLEMLALVKDPEKASERFRALRDKYGDHLHDEAIMLLVLRERDIEFSIRELMLKKS